MLTRSLWAAAACAALLVFGCAQVSSAADPLTVKTGLGRVHGKTINDGKVRAFLGLPYAAPPTGDLRWKAPQPAAKWPGTRDASNYAPHCAQGRVFDDMIFQDNGPSEDCLYLNVYAPAKPAAKKLPVMFWIHGGGYSGGGSNEPRHNGDFLPLKGVVLVTINYRLGVFGFLVTSELAKEDNGSAGNYGLLDMAAALRWVHANIKEFGGDPDNVTIFGESAGSFAVSTLMASPMTRDLIAKAIGESGAAFPSAMSLGGETVAERAKVDEEWMAANGAKTIKDLRAMHADKILEAAGKKGAVGFSPVIDGKFLTESVADTFAAGKQAHVPLLAGWNADEGNFFVMQGMIAEKWQGMAKGLFADRAEEFLKLYPGTTDAQAYRSAIDYGSDSFIAFGTWKWLEAHRKTGNAPVYRYHFELAAPPSKFHEGTFAFHSDDIEYVFGTLDTRPGYTVRPEDRKLSDEVMTYWTNFARSGDPNGSGLAEWPKYGANDEIIHLNAPVSSGPAGDRPRYEFLLKGIPPFHF